MKLSLIIGAATCIGIFSSCRSPMPPPPVPLEDEGLQAMYEKRYDPRRLGLNAYPSSGGFEYSGANRVHRRQKAVLDFESTKPEGMPVFEAKTRARAPFNFLVDSASPYSLITLDAFSRSKAIPLAPPVNAVKLNHYASDLTAYACTPFKLRLDTLHMETPILYFLAGTGPFPNIGYKARKPDIDIILGADLLKSFSFVSINYPKEQILFGGTQPYRPDPVLLEASMPMVFKDGMIAAAGRFNDRALDVIIDTAGDYELALPRPSRPVVTQVYLGELDFRSLVRTPTDLLGLSDHERMGMQAFRQYVLTFDFLRKTIFFEWPVEED